MLLTLTPHRLHEAHGLPFEQPHSLTSACYEISFKPQGIFQVNCNSFFLLTTKAEKINGVQSQLKYIFDCSAELLNWKVIYSCNLWWQCNILNQSHTFTCHPIPALSPFSTNMTVMQRRCTIKIMLAIKKHLTLQKANAWSWSPALLLAHSLVYTGRGSAPKEQGLLLFCLNVPYCKSVS